MKSKRPNDQRFWETDEWECSWIEMTQMLLLYISAHLYVVFLKNERALEYLYLGSVACAWVEDEALSGMFVFTFIPHCVSTVFPYLYPSRPVDRLLAAVCVFMLVCVCVCACMVVFASVWMLVVQSTPLCQILSLVFSLMFWWQ